jgi:2-oxoglutarate ferredoxin oxidoreductase subunit beta
MPLTSKDFDTLAKPDWCPGCGNFGIQVTIKQALANLNIEPHMTAIVGGIGCSSKMPHWVDTYGFHTLHGRSLPPASAVKLANPKLTVIAQGGDGDGYGIGMGHFIHLMRRNIDMTYLVHDNMVYGLTKGQATPTSTKGYKSPSTPFGAIEEPLNPIALALTLGATFVARGYAGDVPHLTKLIEAAIQHKGFALIDIFQPCVTFNKINTYAFFVQHVYKLDADPAYDKTNLEMAYKKSQESDKLPIGIFYQVRKPTYEEQEPGITHAGDPAAPATEETLIPCTELDISNIDISKAMEKYM